MERFSNLVPSFVRSLPDDPAIVETVIISLWRPAVGEAIAEASRAQSFTGGRLTVGVKDKNWKAQLDSIAPELVAKMNRFLGKNIVRYIEIEAAQDLFAVSKED